MSSTDATARPVAADQTDPGRRRAGAGSTGAPGQSGGRTEFIALMAMLMASIAFSLDALLPALPQIARDLTPADPNRAQLVVASFVMGMGAGTLVVGPVADAFGRKAAIFGAAVIYILGAFLAWRAQTLDLLLAARFLQGLGAAGPRVTVMAIIRDRYQGRDMAQMVSFVLVVFMLVPAVAPLIGAGLIALGGWRSLFPAFIAFTLFTTLWLGLRQPETLAPAHRRPLRFGPILAAAREVLGHPVVAVAILVQVCAFGVLFASISTIQMVFDQSFGRAASFPVWFVLMAAVSAAAGILNARLVIRVGMRALVVRSLAVQAALTLVYLAATASGLLQGDAAFAAYVVWAATIFGCGGLVFGNINALALEPMGHIAGTAASLVTAISTIGAALIAGGIGMTFDGTPVPVAAGVLACTLAAIALMGRLTRAARAAA
ncbi:MAG: multidrug effflux MFS transporter [Mangrovicoccus sp.]|nr:multidrug effflux MFS transporter [Mangrovicoccus sp.]